MVNQFDDDDDFDENTDSLDKTSIIPSETFKVRLAQAGQAPPCLVLLVGPANSVGRQWPLEKSEKVVGRSVKADIFIDDKSVSKAHLKVVLSGGDVAIVDMGSTNKTIINGHILEPMKPYKLVNNDQIKTGNVIFKFLEKGNIETVSAAQTFDRGNMDSLTGIHNKGALISEGPQAFKKSTLLGVPFSVLTFDIDHFKKVNDTYGHSAGDYVLRQVASIVRDRLIRGNDFFARSGGEEFTLLLLGSALKQANEVSERIRQTIESHEFVFEGTNIPITISVGASIKNDNDITWEQIFERADKALYNSKNTGRNRCTVIE